MTVNSSMKTTRGPIGPTLVVRDSTTRAESDCRIMTENLIDLSFDETDSQNYVVKETMRAVAEGEISMARAVETVENPADRCRALGTL
jgi:hypothetical protein